ncbi:uncharacterized protein C1orf131 homolog isoform X3 [Misgurnus anguillicaudatus]|uniref:uncharacterized protein C1orf131 homolog isoform X3 n=1 Tax=Misgurnus anguillicaudatus TaxID=75329 RepID=UPI003CCF5746
MDTRHIPAVDDDHLFLDEVLNKLYDFGDGAGKTKSKKSRKRKISSIKDDENNIEENTATVNVSDATVCENTASVSQQSNVEVVTFINPLKKNRPSKPVEQKLQTQDDKEKKKTDSDKKLTIEKARFEVHRFGLSGYQKEQQRIFEQDRAIMLGARPPKKQYVNYKDYQQLLKEKKLKEQEEAKSEAQKKKRKAGKTRPAKSKPSSGGQLGGQVGRFKNGMLVLSSKDIQKVNVKIKK